MARWAVVTFGRGVEPGIATPEVVAQLRQRGVSVAGFFQRLASDLSAHELVRLGLDGCTPVGTKRVRPDPDQSCAFSFQQQAFEAGLAWLKDDAPPADVLLIEPISKLELGGGGHAAALSWALRLPTDQVVIFCARAERLGPVVDRFCPAGDPVAYLECPAAGDGAVDFAARVARAVGRGDCSHE